MFNDDRESSNEPKLSVYKLRKIYREHGIKWKKVVKMPGNPKKFTDDLKLDLLKDLQHNLVVANLKGMDIY